MVMVTEMVMVMEMMMVMAMVMGPDLLKAMCEKLRIGTKSENVFLSMRLNGFQGVDEVLNDVKGIVEWSSATTRKVCVPHIHRCEHTHTHTHIHIHTHTTP